VEIFEHEHQRLHGCQTFEGLGQLAQHTLACRSHHLELQRLELSSTDEPGHLYQPGRGIPSETLDELMASRFPTQSPKGFQHWQI
jgi:hypothetical protein